MKNDFIKLLKGLIILFFSFFIMIICIYNYELSPVNGNKKYVTVTIEHGTPKTKIAKILEEKKLIRSATFFNIYLKLNKVDNLYASTYQLSPSMGTKKIVNILKKGNNYNPNSVTLMFPEGINMRRVAKIISQNTNNKYEDVLKKVNDKAYLQKQINKYWFLTNDILNSNIYYKLEGYLYPDTYEFKDKDVSIEEIFDKMLEQTNNMLKDYKKDIDKSKYSYHQLLTIASMAENEGNEEYRAKITGVFYNRLAINMSLGSDVTTYYAFKIEMNERDLTTEELNTYNPYNTRGPRMNGKIPVGPICNPDINSIKAALYPEKHKYYYFVADKHQKVYFSKTDSEHNATIGEIRRKGDWIEW